LALGGPICALCCGRKRRRTIDCPDDCRYLAEARRRAVERLLDLGADPAKERVMPEVLHNLRFAVVQARNARVRDLTDEEARQALAGASDTMRTRGKGLVYEFKTPDPRIQLVVDELTGVAGLHERADKGFVRARAEDLALALAYLSRQAERAVAEARGPAAFVDLCALVVGREPLRREAAQ
jgi:hypothetical protein